MALQDSGAISFAQIAAEYGDSQPHSLSEFYRNGGKVPGHESINSNVPTSGAIGFGSFYSTFDEELVELSNSTNVNAQSAFGNSIWSGSKRKRIIVPSGVTIGGSGSDALVIPTGMGGQIIVTCRGSIQGFGGSANGGNGGNAIRCNQTANVIIENYGSIYAGGGGGGKGGNGGSGGKGGNGGTGGGGQYTTNIGRGGAGYISGQPFASCNQRCAYKYGSGVYCAHPYNTPHCDLFCDTWHCNGGCTNCRQNVQNNTNGGSGGSGGNGGGGGGGGNGGRGRGYNQSRHNGSGGSGGSGGAYGSGGSNGGTNAGAGGSGGRGGTGGTGGTGGNGGDWGQNGGNGAGGNTGATGNTGNSGANGNRTNGSGGSGGQSGSGGSGGSGGGSRGTYIVNRSSITFTNHGSVAGA